MARRKKHAEHANHERWLISYADFITLLFAFFVVMFASSQGDRGKAQAVSDGVKKALENSHMSAVIAAVLGGTAADKGQGNAQMKGPGGATPQPLAEKQVVELLPSFQVLSQELKKEIDAGQIDVSMQSRGLVVSFNQAALFPSGEDEISTGAHEGLAKIAAAIAKIPNPVRLEGHTDAVRIKNTRFRSNWDLSTARSIALLDIFADRFGLPRNRFSVAGYAETAPVASNDTDEGRAKNRRVDIVLLNEQGSKAEPAKPPQ